MTDSDEGTELDQLCINTVRALAMDSVERAGSGHPGTAMALAPLGYVLFTQHLRHNPADPAWMDRDRFVLSNGHSAILLYSLLHLSGYALSLDDLKQYRQWGSKTPGHPEYRHTPGVETTTGPLGQGVANALGMAMAEAHLAARFNGNGHAIIDHRTWFIAGDGDMMEGITHEAASLAGHLRLGKLIGFYDDNHITIEGATELAFDEDVAARFESYRWHVQRVEDINDLSALHRAIESAKATQDRPSLIIVRSHIAYGSPHAQDTAEAHGAPLGKKEIRLTKKQLGWPYQRAFFVPDAALARWRKTRARGKSMQAQWQKQWLLYAQAHPIQARELTRRLEGKLPLRWDRDIPVFDAGKDMATRVASGKVLNAIAARVPEMIGGSADLAPSTKTLIKDGGAFGIAAYGHRNLHFGVREHAMGGALTGMALHGGVRAYGATFLIFSDYMRASIRLAALMRQRVIYVFTHDSIGLGEDGPTHQPVEQLTSLRAIPGLLLLRPADANETAAAWRVALSWTQGPVALALTRQDVPTLAECVERCTTGLPRGAYVLADASQGGADAIVLASGSEVALALVARAKLITHGVDVRVVSVPSHELFAQQPESYRDEVLPPGVTLRVAIEAGAAMSWQRMVGDQGAVIGIERFGASAPYERIYEEYGLTAEAIVEKVLSLRKSTTAVQKAGRMQTLLQQGQSIWLDYLSRDFLQAGQLQALIARGLRGVTTNPSIFEKAIGAGDAYDPALREMGRKLSDKDAFERLAVQDVQHAADQLRQVYDDSEGTDGFVSLEVSPELARDTEGTIAQARRLWAWVDRPNLMIKIPGTEQGWRAIEHSLAAGINVNITLLFSVRHYRAVAEAHLRALEQRVAKKLPIDRIASVASFFVSRVDSIVEKKLKGKKRELERFAGKIGIANARLAYALFEEIIGSARWRALAAAGARVQRPLWASTGTKNAKFSDVLYVDSLIGEHTVNTLPPDTLAAFEDHGTVTRTLSGSTRDAQTLMDALDEAGIGFVEIAATLEEQGIAAFAKSYDGLLKTLAAKRRKLGAAHGAKRTAK